MSIHPNINSNESLNLNQTSNNSCLIPHYISSFQEFSKCYALFFLLNPSLALFEIVILMKTLATKF